MTSNLASDEIASHAMQLRMEAGQAAKQYRYSQSGESFCHHQSCPCGLSDAVLQPLFIILLCNMYKLGYIILGGRRICLFWCLEYEKNVLRLISTGMLQNLYILN